MMEHCMKYHGHNVLVIKGGVTICFNDMMHITIHGDTMQERYGLIKRNI